MVKIQVKRKVTLSHDREEKKNLILEYNREQF